MLTIPDMWWGRNECLMNKTYGIFANPFIHKELSLTFFYFFLSTAL